MPSEPTAPTDRRAAAIHNGVKIFGYVVLLLIAVTIIYTIWIMVVNWSHIGV